ncbi:MAG: DUF2029 domain-containing protein [Chloroflexi bacterium]|nr:MAG: DUF2029 domain-containing protein [Chloroflexota bacterium]
MIGRLLTRPALYWALAAVFWIRVVVLTVLTPRRPDTEGMWEGARAYLTEPSHMYDAAADYLARLHIIAPPGGLDAFVSPPPVAALAIPIALLPKDVAVQVWTAIDAVALVASLAILFRVVATRHPVAQPVFWLVAGYFPPLFADVSAGQRGGILLVCALASIWLERRNPVIAGAVHRSAAGAPRALRGRPRHRGRGRDSDHLHPPGLGRGRLLLPARPASIARLPQPGLRIRLGAHAVHALHRGRGVRGSRRDRVPAGDVAPALRHAGDRPVLPERDGVRRGGGVGGLAQRMEPGLRDGARLCSGSADPQRGLALPVAASASARAPARRASGGTEASRHPDAARDLHARFLQAALRAVLPEPVDGRRDRNLRFGRVGKSAFPR